MMSNSIAAAGVVLGTVGAGIVALALKVVLAIVVFFVGKKLIHMLIDFIKKQMAKKKTDKSLTGFIIGIAQALLYIALGIVILNLVGYDASSLAALVASAGVAVGLALQGSLSNFAGGVLILLFHPFVVGDYIKEAGGNEGTVTEIGIVYTMLMTPDAKMITIPNGGLANGSIVNYTSAGKRCVGIKCGVSYQADLQKAKAVFRDVLEKEEHRLPNEGINVIVSELGDSAVVLEGKVWVACADYWTAFWGLQEKIKLAFDENGIEIPFPQMNVYLNNKAED